MVLQCIVFQMLCDNQKDCNNGADEHCSNIAPKQVNWRTTSKTPPAVVNLSPSFGALRIMSMTFTDMLETDANETVCPESHFQCLHNGYCLPVHMRCNGINDCPDKEDEAACRSYTCPGFYRCRGVSVCVHSNHVCDGLYHCPQKDDELFCDLVCPTPCTCYGLSLFCHQLFQVDQARDARYLDASHSGLTHTDLVNSTMLVYLRLANCSLLHLDNMSFVNLHVLDVSQNQISRVTVQQLREMTRLRELILANNPLVPAEIFSDASLSNKLDSLKTLDVSRVRMHAVPFTMLASFPNLYNLNFSHSGIDLVEEGAFASITNLRKLDFIKSPLTSFSPDMLKGLYRLERVYSDNYKLCCPQTLPVGFNPELCFAPFDEFVSSCDALLRLNMYRIMMSIFCFLALAGNVGSVVIRWFVLSNTKTSGFTMMVTSLCVSDFLMGVYLAIVGVADHIYAGTYLWRETEWRESSYCAVAGFLSLLSSEVSAFLIFLITLDRFLALRFPFSGVKFQKGSALAACAVTWLGGAMLAAVPLLPTFHHWNFYSQTGICIPLPVSNKGFPGYHFVFSVMIVFNFVLFVLIASGQAFIYNSMRASSMASADTTRKSQDLKVARRLITVAVTDFVCWFPIALLGLLASQGVSIPGEVNVALAIIVLPLNSALNPYVYNLNVLLDKRRRVQEEKLLKLLTTKQNLI